MVWPVPAHKIISFAPLLPVKNLPCSTARREGFQIQPIHSTRIQHQTPGHRDHGSVVGAMHRTRDVQRGPSLAALTQDDSCEFFTQHRVGAHAPGQYHGAHARLLHRTHGLGDEHGGDGVGDRRAQIAQVGGDVPGTIRLRHRLKMIQHRGFEPGKAEFVPFVEEGFREAHEARVMTLGVLIHDRTRRIPQSQQLPGLVEGFAGGVVAGFT